MYAVIESGGKQYRVQPGDFLQVEKLDGELGSTIQFDEVLFISKGDPEKPEIILGTPHVKGAVLHGEVVGQGRGEKILIIKMKRRKQYRRTQGHRQSYTQILITSLENGSGVTKVLTAEEKKEKLAHFQTHLKPKGEAFTAPILGSRKRIAEAKSKAHATAQAV